MSAAPLTELKESDASGRIAEIYTDIRYSLGVPMVNLIFRHLATVPDCLEWLWEQVGSLYVSGALTAAAADITAQQSVPALALAREDLLNCGLDAGAVEAVRATCAAYARANPANLIALHALDLILAMNLQDSGARKSKAFSAANAQPCVRAAVVAVTPLPPMGNLQTLPGTTVAMLRALAIQVHGEDGPIIPSFYRHFTPWPAFLGLLHDKLVPLIAQVNAAVADFERAGRAQAQTLLQQHPVRPALRPRADAVQALRVVIAQFSPNLCKMTLIPLALRAALHPSQ